METIYLKLTNCCNLKCLHCYNKIAFSHGKDIDDDVLEKSLEYIDKKAILLGNECLNVILHGGEPMLYSHDKIELLIQRLKLHKNIIISITSNLVYLLTDLIIRIFKQCSNGLNCSIATSWDYKIRFSSIYEEKLWKKNVKTLIDNNIDVLPIVCITKLLIADINPDSLFSQMKLLGVTAVNLERITLTGRAVDNNVKPTNREVDEWMYEAYIAKDKYHIHVPIIDALIESFESHSLLGCRCRTCTKTVRTINPDGTIAMCPNTADIIIGDIYGQAFTDKEQFECFKEKYKRVECYECEYCQFCNGECYQLNTDETGCPGCLLIMNDLALKQNIGNVK